MLEITSKSTYSEDQGAKRGVYALLGVKEYWQYDPTGDYLEPRLQGLQLIERNYWPLPVQERSGSDLLMHSAVLGLDLRLEEGQLRFHDSATGEPLRSHAEAEFARQEAEQARQAAKQASQAAEQARQDAEARAEEELRQRRALEARLAELEQRFQHH